MTEFRCAVIRVGDEWTIAYNGQQFGTFRDQLRAVDAAMRLARDVAREGRPVHVLVQTSTGELRLQARI